MNHSTNILDEEEISFLIALKLCKGIGNITIKKLIEEFKSVKSIWDKRVSLSKNKLIHSALEEIKNKNLLKKAADEIHFMKERKIKIIHYLDDNYPELLKDCKDGPVLLFQKGNLNLKKRRKIISIVGSRKMTSYGEKFINELIDELTPHSPIIVSGLALGADAKAHRKALENGLDTIAVLAHGLHKIYPVENAFLAKEIQENGALLSEYCSFEKMRKENFPLRNRIIAGISQGIVVVESASRGGAIITAKYANNYNREVFALPGKIHDIFSQGTNELIRTHQANIITCTRDLEEMLNWDQVQALGSEKEFKKKLETSSKENEPNLMGKEKLIYEVLKSGKMHLDSLHAQLEIPINELMGLLFSLEMKDIIKSLEGKYFEVKKF